MNKKWKVVGKKYIENEQKQLVASTIILKGSTLKKDEENETIAQTNAHLIAAAPEMYQMLEQAVGALKQYWEYGEAMREHGKGFQASYKGYSDYDLKVMEQVLKKARGES